MTRAWTVLLSIADSVFPGFSSLLTRVEQSVVSFFRFLEVTVYINTRYYKLQIGIFSINFFHDNQLLSSFIKPQNDGWVKEVLKNWRSDINCFKEHFNRSAASWRNVMRGGRTCSTWIKCSEWIFCDKVVESTISLGRLRSINVSTANHLL